MRSAWAELRSHPVRLASVALAIAISVAFVVASLVFVATETSAIGRQVTAESSTSDVLVRTASSSAAPNPGTVAAVPGVAAVATTSRGYVPFQTPEGPGLMALQALPDRPEFGWSRLDSGRWPRTADEIAVSAVTSHSYGLLVGSVLTVEQGRHGTAGLRVTGIVDQSRQLLGNTGDTGTVDGSYFRAHPGSAETTLLVRTDAGAAAEVVAARIQTALGPDVGVQTATAARAAALAEVTGVADVFGYLVLVFGSIALLVGSMTIANTAVIILAARRREIGLLRAVGASTGQVRRRLLTEALLTGVVGSAAGVLVGTGVAAGAAALSGSLAAGLVVPGRPLLLVAVGGVVVTGLSTLLPVLRATRTAPLEALRPVADQATERRSGRVRLIVGGALTLAGAIGAGAALQQHAHVVVLAAAASSVAAVGVLALAPVFVPPLLRGSARLVTGRGPVPRLAAGNLARNPLRSAATCTALMLAVGLIVTLQVGAASVKSTSSAALDEQFPVDLTLTNPEGPVAEPVRTALAGTPGITATVPVRVVSATVVQPPVAQDEERTITVAAPGPGAAAVVSAGLDRLDDSTALVHPSVLSSLGRQPGDRLTLSYQGRQQTVVLVPSDVADAGMLVVTDASMSALAPTAPVASVWAAAADRKHAAQVIAGVRKAMATQPGLVLAGSLPQAAEVGAVLDAVLEVATGLLGVAALIALVGIGNALGLSVLERTRESALLRALGLSRRGLRGMLGVEATLLALVGSAVGVAVGVVFGSVGAAALNRETQLGTLHLAVSIPQTLAVVALSCLAGAVASVLPGRRAALASPTAALGAG